MSKQKLKSVPYDTARIAAQKENKKITRPIWAKGVYLIKGNVWFFMMRTTDNKLITYIPTDEDKCAEDWTILD